MAVQHLDRAQKMIKRRKRQLGTWRAVGREMGLSAGTLIRVANGYEPKAPHIRRALGLPLIVAIRACAKCGQIHSQRKSCSSKPRKRKPPFVHPLLAAIRSALTLITKEDADEKQKAMRE